MRKESRTTTSDDEIWGTTVTMVSGRLNEKMHENPWFLMNHSVPMAINHGFITWEDGKCYRGYYDMLHYAIGAIATAQ